MPPTRSAAKNDSVDKEDMRELSRNVASLATQSAAIVERLDVVIEDNKDLKSRVRVVEDWQKAADTKAKAEAEVKKSMWKAAKDAGGIVHAVWVVLAAAFAWIAAGGKIPLH